MNNNPEKVVNLSSNMYLLGDELKEKSQNINIVSFLLK